MIRTVLLQYFLPYCSFKRNSLKRKDHFTRNCLISRLLGPSSQFWPHPVMLYNITNIDNGRLHFHCSGPQCDSLHEVIFTHTHTHTLLITPNTAPLSSFRPRARRLQGRSRESQPSCTSSCVRRRPGWLPCGGRNRRPRP